MKRRLLQPILGAVSGLILVLPVLVLAQSNAGFVQGLWYDQEMLFVGEPVRIYAAIRNNTGGDLSGTVEFYVNGERIERNDVAALSNRIVESWTDWTPSYGTSTIKATLSRTEISSTASGTKRVNVVSALTEDIIFVDYDTDGDGVGNASDSDDDGDGVSDEKEKENGTDPLTYNKPVGNDDETGESNEETSEQPEQLRESSGEPEGLEQFLNESRADDALSSITGLINNTRENLDEYRSRRNAARAVESAQETPTPMPESSASVDDSGTTTATSTVEENSDGSFGEIERRAPEPEAEPEKIWPKIWDFIKRNLAHAYTFVLFITSWFLWHPILVQLALLFLILFVIYKVARRLGGRGEK